MSLRSAFKRPSSSSSSPLLLRAALAMVLLAVLRQPSPLSPPSAEGCLCHVIPRFSCPEPPRCCESGYYTFDECGCCMTCAKAELQDCGGPSGSRGKCSKGLACLKTCAKCETIGSQPEPCVFPFKYGGQTFNRCTSTDAETGSVWCATKVDDKGVVVEGRWGDCSEGCPGARNECNDLRFSIITGSCINPAVPGAIPDWKGAPSYRLQRLTDDLFPAPPCKRAAAVKQRKYANTCRCAEGEDTIEIGGDGQIRGNCTGFDPKAKDKGRDNSKAWCFLENVRDPEEPRSGCFPDVKWSSRDGRFWSSDACSGLPAPEYAAEGAKVKERPRTLGTDHPLFREANNRPFKDPHSFFQQQNKLLQQVLDQKTTTNDPLEDYLEYYDYLYNLDKEDADSNSLPLVNGRVKQKEGDESIEEDEDVTTPRPPATKRPLRPKTTPATEVETDPPPRPTKATETAPTVPTVPTVPTAAPTEAPFAPTAPVAPQATSSAAPTVPTVPTVPITTPASTTKTKTTKSTERTTAAVAEVNDVTGNSLDGSDVLLFANFDEDLLNFEESGEDVLDLTKTETTTAPTTTVRTRDTTIIEIPKTTRSTTESSEISTTSEGTVPDLFSLVPEHPETQGSPTISLIDPSRNELDFADDLDYSEIVIDKAGNILLPVPAKFEIIDESDEISDESEEIKDESDSVTTTEEPFYPTVITDEAPVLSPVSQSQWSTVDPPSTTLTSTTSTTTASSTTTTPTTSSTTSSTTTSTTTTTTISTTTTRTTTTTTTTTTTSTTTTTTTTSTTTTEREKFIIRGVGDDKVIDLGVFGSFWLQPSRPIDKDRDQSTTERPSPVFRIEDHTDKYPTTDTYTRVVKL